MILTDPVTGIRIECSPSEYLELCKEWIAEKNSNGISCDTIISGNEEIIEKEKIIEPAKSEKEELRDDYAGIKNWSTKYGIEEVKTFLGPLNDIFIEATNGSAPRGQATRLLCGAAKKVLATDAIYEVRDLLSQLSEDCGSEDAKD